MWVEKSHGKNWMSLLPSASWPLWPQDVDGSCCRPRGYIHRTTLPAFQQENRIPGNRVSTARAFPGLSFRAIDKGSEDMQLVSEGLQKMVPSALKLFGSTQMSTSLDS